MYRNRADVLIVFKQMGGRGFDELQYDDGVQLERIVERLIYLGERMNRTTNSGFL